MTGSNTRISAMPVFASSQQKLKIAVIAPPFLPVPPQGYGGTERVVSSLTEGLVKRGHEVTLFAAAGSLTAAKLISPLPTAPLLGDPDSLSDDLYHLTAAYELAGAFDVIHDHTGMGPALGAMLEKIPVVHTLHGPWTATSRRFFKLVHKRVQLVAISYAQRAANPHLHYAGVVHNGIDLTSHPLHERKQDFLVFVGRINAEKRPELAIEIARRSGLPLVMIVKRTEPAEQLYWDSAVRPLLGSDVEVLEQPPHDIKVDVVGRARAMLFPIDWPEPFGLVMTEAMACGTPVIAKPLGAAPEVISHRETGFLCNSLDQMVEAVHASKDIRPVDCRRRVEESFSADAMVKRYQDIYASSVEDRGLLRSNLPDSS